MRGLRLRAISAIRRFAGHPAFPPWGRMVRPWPAFVARELLRRRGTRVYRLRDSGLRVALRHGTGDAATLTEVFHLYYYRPPAEVARVIDQPLAILDLGANVGLFGLFAAARWPQARIVGYEPDPANAAVHRRTLSANGLEARWTLVGTASGNRDGEMRFAGGLDALSHLVGQGADEGGPTINVPVRDVLPQLCAADLVKMDIEGGEWEILGDPRLRQQAPRAIVLEYHPRNCPGPDPRATAEQALRAAGLQTAVIWHRDDGHGMLWGWRPAAALNPGCS